MIATEFPVYHALLEEDKHLFGLTDKVDMVRFFSLGLINIRSSESN
jgi:hypothetical protein